MPKEPYKPLSERERAAQQADQAAAAAHASSRAAQIARIEAIVNATTDEEAPHWVEWVRTETPAEEHQRKKKLFGRSKAPERQVSVTAGWALPGAFYTAPYKDAGETWSDAVLDTRGRFSRAWLDDVKVRGSVPEGSIIQVTTRPTRGQERIEDLNDRQLDRVERQLGEYSNSTK